MAVRQETEEAGQAARRAAARILGAVLVERMFLDVAVLEMGVTLTGPERARARTIADGVLRKLAALDALIDPHLKPDTPVRIRHVLRIAAWEMLVDGVAAHAAVDGAVRSAKATRKVSQLAGLTNAVARKLEAGDLDPSPATLPGYLRKPLVAAYSGKVVSAMEAVHAVVPPVDLSLRDRNEADSLAADLGAALLPTGSLRLDRPGQISALPGYADGAWWVQDAAAAVPVRLLGDPKGARVLDLCAAPGGKTMQLAALGADVTAVDASSDRLVRLTENLARTKLAATVTCADVLDLDLDPFDIVVLDAPCSATGTLRRHPDLPFVKKDLALAPILALQERLVTKAAALVRPSGHLLYCVCSLLPSEGGAQVHRLLSDGWTVDNQRPPGVDPDWFDKQGHLRLRPDYWSEIGGMDGFFATVLKKPG